MHPALRAVLFAACFRVRTGLRLAKADPNYREQERLQQAAKEEATRRAQAKSGDSTSRAEHLSKYRQRPEERVEAGTARKTSTPP